jgi:chemotaxis protein methyltransferase CheR
MQALSKATKGGRKIQEKGISSRTLPLPAARSIRSWPPVSPSLVKRLMDDRHFRKILDRLGLSWPGYRKVRKGVKKRIRRHMLESGFRRVETYLAALERSDALRRKCELLLTVSISRFFRDRLLWEVLEDRILPDLLMKGLEEIRVWSAGCACGEEAYTFKILWQGLLEREESLPPLTFLASDMNPLYLEKARTGIYPRSSLKEVPEERRSLHFLPREGGTRYMVKPSLKEGILWKEHHLLYDPPEKDFHLIFLRNNLLTYNKAELSGPAFRMAVAGLRRGGFLIIGSHEKIPFETPGLNTFGPLPYVFQRRGG